MIIIFIQSINSQLLKNIFKQILYSNLFSLQNLTKENNFTLTMPSLFVFIFIILHSEYHKTVSSVVFVFAQPGISSILFKNIIGHSSIFCYFYSISLFFVTYWLIHAWELFMVSIVCIIPYIIRDLNMRQVGYS